MFQVLGEKYNKFYCIKFTEKSNYQKPFHKITIYNTKTYIFEGIKLSCY